MSFSLLTRMRAERRRRARSSPPAPPPTPPRNLYEFIRRAAPKYGAPRHLDRLIQQLHRAWTEPVRVCAHAPPRHGKTETVLLWIALTLLLHPEKTCAYVTYGADLAASKSRKVRQWFVAMGGQLAKGAAGVLEWRTAQGGGLIAGGVDGPLTGKGVDILFVDDPYKNRVQAESPAYQRMVLDWWGDVANTRIEPGGSIFVFHTRWTTADLIGKILDGEDQADWLWICLAAIAEETTDERAAGTALWPERWPVEELLKKKKAVGAFTWASLYQGRPQPRGGAVFGTPHYYLELPAGAVRKGIGLDLAYSAKTKGDYSVAVVLLEHQGVYYVLDVRRVQLPAPAFTERLKLLKLQHPGAPFRFIGSGTEIGTADFIKEHIPLTVESASADKFVRSIDLAAAWNAGLVLLPSAPTEWVPALLDEFAAFTGAGDFHDDQVDAMEAARRALASKVSFSDLDKYRDRLPKRRC